MPWQGKVFIVVGLTVVLALSVFVPLILVSMESLPKVEQCQSLVAVLDKGDSARCHPAARLSVEHLYGATVVARCECPAVPERAVVVVVDGGVP